MQWPFIRRQRLQDALLDADRRFNQVEHAARTYRDERDRLRAALTAVSNYPH
ncbi:hypothetical protein [Sphingomonas sp. SAFR-052]|uniref:hypothetical protein n=1 Tax=Sphingomonas sp. SAFR-052 TaxID=3436867 RepID=UPI003F809D00